MKKINIILVLLLLYSSAQEFVFCAKKPLEDQQNEENGKKRKREQEQDSNKKQKTEKELEEEKKKREEENKEVEGSCLYCQVGRYDEDENGKKIDLGEPKILPCPCSEKSKNKYHEDCMIERFKWIGVFACDICKGPYNPLLFFSTETIEKNTYLKETIATYFLNKLDQAVKDNNENDLPDILKNLDTLGLLTKELLEARLKIAVKNNKNNIIIVVLRWIIENHKDMIAQEIIFPLLREAISCSNLGAMKWIFENLKDSSTKDGVFWILTCVAPEAEMEPIKFIIEYYGTKLTKEQFVHYVLGNSVYLGKQRIVEFMLKNCMDILTPYDISWAFHCCSRKSVLILIKWALENNKSLLTEKHVKKCMISVFDGCAFEGKLETMKWIFENCRNIVNDSDIVSVFLDNARYGFLAAEKDIYSVCGSILNDKMKFESICQAAWGEHISMLEHLLEKFKDKVTPEDLKKLLETKVNDQAKELIKKYLKK